jgi:hypothetical protein
MSDNKKPRVAVYCRVGRKEQLSEAAPAFAGHGVEFNGDSMYELLSMHDGYNDVTRAAMELVLEEGPDALMYQLNYDDVDFLREEFPVIYKRAIELGILTEEE